MFVIVYILHNVTTQGNRPNPPRITRSQCVSSFNGSEEEKVIKASYFYAFVPTKFHNKKSNFNDSECVATHSESFEENFFGGSVLCCEPTTDFDVMHDNK